MQANPHAGSKAIGLVASLIYDHGALFTEEEKAAAERNGWF